MEYSDTQIAGKSGKDTPKAQQRGLTTTDGQATTAISNQEVSLPVSIKRLVKSSVDFQTGDRYLPKMPDTVTMAQKRDIQTALTELQRKFIPVTKEALKLRISSLLELYPTKKGHEGMAKYVAFEWMDSLGEFPQWAINQACREYRNSDREWKPLPGQIRKLTLKAMGGEWEEFQRLKELATLPEKDRPAEKSEIHHKPTEAQKDRVRSIVASMKVNYTGIGA